MGPYVIGSFCAGHLRDGSFCDGSFSDGTLCRGSLIFKSAMAGTVPRVR